MRSGPGSRPERARPRPIRPGYAERAARGCGVAPRRPQLFAMTLRESAGVEVDAASAPTYSGGFSPGTYLPRGATVVADGWSPKRIA